MTDTTPETNAAASPSYALMGLEPLRAALEFAEHHFMDEGRLPRGDGHAVVIYPGLATNERGTRPLLSFCERLGYQPIDWGQGLNVGPKGDVLAWLDELAERTAALTAEHAAPISLIGWSLGGIYAREVAKRLHVRVRQVVTIGTPFAGTVEQSNVGMIYRVLNGSAPPTDAALLQAIRTAPPVPTTSIYSRSDGIVAWQSCVDETPAKYVENIEVGSSHCGMAWNPEVLRVIADRLAQRHGNWAPYACAATTAA